MNRLHMRNSTHMVEFSDNNTGKMQIKALRRSHPEFKGRRIKEVFQLIPEAVPCGEVVELT